MPLWPIPPLIAIVGVILALTQQAEGDLIKTAVIILIAVVYWFAYLRTKTYQKESQQLESTSLD